MSKQEEIPQSQPEKLGTKNSMEQAWDEAFERLEEVDEKTASVLINLTSRSDAATIKEYLEKNRNVLSLQAVFFLETTLQRRKEDPKRDEAAREIGKRLKSSK